jgi:hypothetical protein
MLHACVQRFDVTENLKILAKFLSSKLPNKLAQWATEQAPGDLLPGLRNILVHQQQGLVRGWAYPGFNKNGYLSQKRDSANMDGQTPYRFFVPLPVDSVPFPFIPKKRKQTEKYSIWLRTEHDLSRPFSSLIAAPRLRARDVQWTVLSRAPPMEATSGSKYK